MSQDLRGGPLREFAAPRLWLLFLYSYPVRQSFRLVPAVKMDVHLRIGDHDAFFINTGHFQSLA